MRENLDFDSEGDFKRFLISKGIDEPDVARNFKLEGTNKRGWYDRQFFQEIQKGEATLGFDEEAGRVFREVQILNLDILHGNQVLSETHRAVDGTLFKRVEQLPTTISQRIPSLIQMEDEIASVVSDVLNTNSMSKWKGVEIGGVTTSEIGLESEYIYPQIWTIYQILTTSIELTKQQYEMEKDYHAREDYGKHTMTDSAFYEWKDRQYT